jgi:hypothetical protein
MTAIDFEKGYITDAQVVMHTSEILPTAASKKSFQF